MLYVAKTHTQQRIMMSNFLNKLRKDLQRILRDRPTNSYKHKSYHNIII